MALIAKLHVVFYWVKRPVSAFFLEVNSVTTFLDIKSSFVYDGSYIRH